MGKGEGGGGGLNKRLLHGIDRMMRLAKTKSDIGSGRSDKSRRQDKGGFCLPTRQKGGPSSSIVPSQESVCVHTCIK